MGLFGKPDYYSGQQCYKFAEGLIRRGREILIVSPYIDGYYARFLMENSDGKKIKILSSSMDPEAKRILRRKKPLGMLSAVSLLVLSVDYLSLTARLLTIFVIVVSAIILAVALVAFKLKKYEMEVKVPRGFVHAKMYISENEAIHGSANLTYSGMHKNVEHIEVIREREKIEMLRKEFYRLWD